MIIRCMAAEVEKEFCEIGDALNGFFKKTGNKPANTLFGGNLLLPWMKIEIEATAMVQPAAGKRTVLVTSATGRIGKEVVARLSQSGQFNVQCPMCSAQC